MDNQQKCILINSIKNLLDNIGAGAKGYHEPDYIAKLVKEISGQLETELNKLKMGMSFKVGGCFIHQKPIVEFLFPRRVRAEVGDF